MATTPSHITRHVLALLASSLLVSACTVGKDYVEPELDVDEAWVATEGETLAEKNAVPTDWWRLFNDATLNQLIDTAIKNNNDLKIAEARIAEARANETLSDSAFFPQIDATGSRTRGTMGGVLDDKLENTTRSGVNGRWEIDIFGGNRRRSEAAEAGTEAAIADREATRLQLIAEVARNYIRLRALQQQRALTVKNLGLQNGTVDITQAQYDERVVSRLDVLRARTQMRTTRTILPQIDAESYAAINRITVLLGERVRNVKSMLNTPRDIPEFPRAVIRTTPLGILKRRPDIRAAERRLAQATALTGAAFANFFPKLSLEGFFGSSDSSVYGSSSPWSVTLGALMPLLNFGRIQSQVDIADAQQQQAFYYFKQSVLLAIEEVEVGFSGYFRAVERQNMFVDIAREQSEAAYIARQQYINGIAPQLDLLNAEQNALNAETNYTLARAAAADNIIRLYTALGTAAEVKKPTRAAKDQPAPLSALPAPSTAKRPAPDKAYPKILKPGEDPNLYP